MRVCDTCTCVDVVFLTYIYMLEFVLDDGSGWLSATLWREDAVSQFHLITADTCIDLECLDWLL